MASTLFMVAYIAKVRPYVSSLDNMQELVNEMLAMLAAYPLLVFKSYEWSQEYRINIAWILISLITVLILFNLVVYCYAVVKWIKLKCRNHHAKTKAKQLKKAAGGTPANSNLESNRQIPAISLD